MPDPSASPRHPRYPIQLPFLYRSKGPAPTRAGVGWTRNLSEGGACVELAEGIQPPMLLQLFLQTDHGPIEVEAQVVWAGEPSVTGGGVLYGVAFTQVAPDQQQTLQALLRSPQTQRRHAGIRLPADIAVLYRRKGKAGPPLQGWAENISRAGLLLCLPEALPPGTTLEVLLQIPNEPVTAEGAIVWVEPPTGRKPGEPIRHGFRFTALGWSTALALVLFQAALP